MNRLDLPVSTARRERVGWCLLGRWLLLLLLAFDLVSSPFHAHSHDLGSDHLGPQAEAHAVDTIASLRASDLHPPGFGHSQAALRSLEPRLDDAPIDPALAVFGALSAAAAIAVAVTRAWFPAATASRPAPAGRFLRPDGRAPPDCLSA